MGRRSKAQIELDNQQSNNNSETSIDVDDEKLKSVIEEYKTEKEEKKPRKKKLNKDELDAQNSFTQTAVFSVHIALNILIARMPKNIPLTSDEEKAFDEAFTNLAKKYYSSVQRFGEELNFALVLGFLLIPRLDFNKKKKESETLTEIKETVKSE